MNLKINFNDFKLLFFSIITSFITYGFALTNYSLSVDSESPIYRDCSLSLGRWGTNLVRYHIFEGHTPYFTLLLGLLLLSITAVELSKIFKLNDYLNYVFCVIFLTFPQHAYQLIFTMQADIIPLGFLCSVLVINLFIKSTYNLLSFKSIGYFILASLLFMFVIALYQALIFIPIVIFLILLIQSFDDEKFNLKTEIHKGLLFTFLILLSTLLYFFSVKLLCPPIEGGYLSTYTSGNSNDRFIDFYNLWLDNLGGNAYYGEKTFILASLLGLALLIKIGVQKKLFVLKSLTLFLLMLIPFFISFFITNNTHPPRIYVTSGIVFGFVFVHLFKNFKAEKIVVVLSSVLFLTHLYFITQLFYSNYRIFNHDKDLAKKIDFEIQTNHPAFEPDNNYIYFYGGLPYDHHEKLRLPNSEIFGGSLFSWDNGSNYRIINFFKFNDIAYYKFIDNKETYLKIKDSMNSMPTWPKKESIKMINNVLVVKLGDQKGAPLPGNVEN